MNNALLAEIIVAIALKLPEFAIDLIQVLAKPDATDADYEVIRVKYRGKTFDGYISSARQAKNA